MPLLIRLLPVTPPGMPSRLLRKRGNCGQFLKVDQIIHMHRARLPSLLSTQRPPEVLVPCPRGSLQALRGDSVVCLPVCHLPHCSYFRLAAWESPREPTFPSGGSSVTRDVPLPTRAHVCSDGALWAAAKPAFSSFTSSNSTCTVWNTPAT